MTRVIFLLLSLVPLIWHSPYLLRAWSGSRLDHWDWIFYLLALPALCRAFWGEKPGRPDWRGAVLLLPMLLLTASGSIHHVNALCIAAAVGVVFAAIWLLFSWGCAYQALPAAMLLLLGTPSSSYQLSLLLMFPVGAAWTVKFLLAMLCFVWVECNRRRRWHFTPGTLLFTAASLCSAFLLMHTGELYFEGRKFIPEFSGRAGNYWGRSLVPDENTRRFFATSKVRQFRYTGNNVDISVLAVQCGSDIHEIHPASHCLRTGMWTVHAEKILHLRDNFAVTEIDAEKGASRCLVWVWFSSEEFSTPSFLGFRRHFKSGGSYHTFQLSIPVFDGNLQQSREMLREFVAELEKEGQR